MDEHCAMQEWYMEEWMCIKLAKEDASEWCIFSRQPCHGLSAGYEVGSPMSSLPHLAVQIHPHPMSQGASCMLGPNWSIATTSSHLWSDSWLGYGTQANSIPESWESEDDFGTDSDQPADELAGELLDCVEAADLHDAYHDETNLSWYLNHAHLILSSKSTSSPRKHHRERSPCWQSLYPPPMLFHCCHPMTGTDPWCRIASVGPYPDEDTYAVSLFW